MEIYLFVFNNTDTFYIPSPLVLTLSVIQNIQETSNKVSVQPTVQPENVSSPSHVCLLPIKKISEQPHSNGEPKRHTVQWKVIRTAPKTTRGPPMGHVPVVMIAS